MGGVVFSLSMISISLSAASLSFYVLAAARLPWSFCFTLESPTAQVRGDSNLILIHVSTQHTRKTFFAKAFAGLAGLGLFGGARLAAKPAAEAPGSSGDAAKAPFRIETDPRSVAREANSL
jgi:hypothetical protein